MKHHWYYVVAALGFLVGSLVWELRADYAPLTPAPTASRYSTLFDEPQRGFLILVRPVQRRCEVHDAAGTAVATFECRPTGVRW